jgi:His/Glu/Gln/Arg/opine family amino acid ABC transporter permease subunit
VSDEQRVPDKDYAAIYISRSEPPTLPSPVADTGILKWMQANLFSSVGNAILTAIGLLVVIYTVVGVTEWVIAKGNWLSITVNLRQYLVGSFPPQLIWRLQVLSLFSIFVMGMCVAIWIRPIARKLLYTIVIIILVLFLLPAATKLLVDLPKFYMVAGDGIIQSGSVTEMPVPQVAFVGRADDEITIRMAGDRVESEGALAGLAGYTSTAANTLRNAAANRLRLIAERAALLEKLRANEERISEDGIPLLTASQVEAYTEQVAALEERIPAPVIDTYAINSRPMVVSILSVTTGETVGEVVVLETAEDTASFTLPEDGWYILEKVDADPEEIQAVEPAEELSEEESGEQTAVPTQTNSQDIRNVSTIAPTGPAAVAQAAAEGGGTVALLEVQGIYPVRLGNIPGQRGFVQAFVRATDFFSLPVRDYPVPRDESNTDMPYIVLTSNQYRGERSLGDFLRASITPLFDRVKVNFSIFLVTGVLGYLAADTVQTVWKTRSGTWQWYDSFQIWLIWLVVLSLIMGPVSLSDAMKALLSVVLVLYGLWLLMKRGAISSARSLATVGLFLIPIVMWLYVNGFKQTTAVALLGVIALGMLCMATYQLSQRNGWRELFPSRGILDGGIPVIVMILISYLALMLMLTRIDDGGWPVWIIRLGFIPLVISALAGGSLNTPDGHEEVSTSSITTPFVLAGLIILAIFFTDVGGPVPNSEWLFTESNPDSWSGLLLTMVLTVYGIIIAFPIGIGLALGRRSDLPLIKYLCTAYIELIRGSPFITVLFFMKLLIPLISPELASVPNGYRAIVATIAFSAAYLAENVRGGLQSLPHGQLEAAKALGLSAWKTTVLITLPQALRVVIPALVGQFISLFKDTSLVTIIGLIDLTGVVNSMAVQPEFVGTRLEGLVFISIIYFVFSYGLSYVSRLLEASGSGATRRNL